MRHKCVFHFPNGNIFHSIDMDHCFSQINIGELVRIEGDPIVYKVSNIYNEFKSELVMDLPKLRMIERSIILSRDY